MATGRGGSTALWGLAAKFYWRKARHRLRLDVLHRVTVAGRSPERVLVAPPDLRLADPSIAAEIYRGTFVLAGRSVDSAGRPPFALTQEDREWQRELHNFRWLRHLHAAGTDLGGANARSLVSEWMNGDGRRLRGVAWEPSVTAERIIAWLQHSSIVLKGADVAFYRRFLRSLAAHVRYLRAALSTMPEGEGRLRARVAITMAALAMPAPPATLRAAVKALDQELRRQILPDGGHISRNPLSVLDLLADLLPLRATFANQSEAPSPGLLGAIDRMMPALRFFRHRDGSLARFNGMGATPGDRLSAVLRQDETGGASLMHAPHSGYHRLSAGGTTVIADTGAAPDVSVSQFAHAGCLSLEMSTGGAMLIVNAGMPTFGSHELRRLGRTTAAHSTACLNDNSSARFSHPPSIERAVGTVLTAGPSKVASQRVDRPGWQGFVASHDGYVRRFGIWHERQVALSERGDRLAGADRFQGESGGAIPDDGHDQAVIRFHLHPDVVAVADAGGVMLAMADGTRWLFQTDGPAAVIDDSIFFADPNGPRRTKAIVLAFGAAGIAEARWQFLRLV